jgi:hypothetical protein
MPRLPWDYHPDLSLERLRILDKILRQTRSEALALHDPGAGDTAWSLGCRVYARSTSMLIRAAHQFPWLKIVQSNLEFIFQVGEVPLRFFKGDAEHPDLAHLQAVEAESKQLGLAFGDARDDLVWRLVVETDAAGGTGNIVLIGSSPQAELGCTFTIPPLEDSVRLFDSPRPLDKPGVQLPPPVISARRKVTREG